MAETTATETTGSTSPRETRDITFDALHSLAASAKAEPSKPVPQPAEPVPEPVAVVMEEPETADCQVALGGVIDAIARMDTAKAIVSSVAKELSDLRMALDAYPPDAFLDSTVAGVRVPLTSKVALLAKRAELQRACDEVRKSYENLMENQTNLADTAYLPEPERPMIVERSAVPQRLAMEQREESMNAHLLGPSDDMLREGMAEVLRSERPRLPDRQAAPRMAERPYQPQPRRPTPRVEEPEEEIETPGFLRRMMGGRQQAQTN